MKFVSHLLLFIFLVIAGCSDSPSESNFSHESLEITYPLSGSTLTGWDSVLISDATIEPIDSILLFIGDSVLLKSYLGIQLPLKFSVNTALYPSDLLHLSCRVYSHKTQNVNGEIFKNHIAYDSDTIEVEFDNTPPNNINSLELLDSTYNSITVGWQAPGDNDSVGQATTYDIRYQIWEMNNGNFKNCLLTDSTISPAPSGQHQSLTITGLSANRQYYVAVKSTDEVGNKSDISNIVSGTTIPIFAEPVLYSTTVAIREIFSGDFDNDGDLDVALFQSGGYIYIYLNDGAGNFTLSFSEYNQFSIYDVVCGDFDNANGPDFVFSIRYGSSGWPDSTQMISLLNDGTGNFSQRYIFDSTHLLNFNPINFNNDGYLDLIGEVNGRNRITIYKGKGDGTFDVIYFENPSQDGLGVIRTVGGDVNGDGYDDVMMLSYGGKYLLFNNKNDSLLNPIEISDYYGGEWLHSGDINQDGLSDLVILSGNVHVYLSNGAGLMSPISLSGNNPLLAHTLDIDADGHTDLVAGGISEGGCSVFLNKGKYALEFIPPSILTYPADAYRFTFADFDDDGDPDLVVAYQRHGNGFGYFENMVIDAR
ncbi:MAG: hypothetical protein DWP97_13830 [Calditrichaeota bacterium]|nr:MAG: hypothetical protein DWP97_13830 [Calditrichota bacterium]